MNQASEKPVAWNLSKAHSKARKIILLFPEMRVTKKTFTRAAAKNFLSI